MPYFLLILCSGFAVWIYIRRAKVRRLFCVAKLRRRKKIDKGEIELMLKFAETLIGKSCSVHTIDHDYDGTLVEIDDGFLVLKDRWYDTLVFVNPEYIVGIRENKEKKSRKKAQESVQTTDEGQ